MNQTAHNYRRVVSVEEITIYETGIVISGRWLTASSERILIFKDGFDEVHEFYQYFSDEHCLPFWGLLIKLEPINRG